MGLFRRSHSFKLSPLSLSVPLGGCDTVVGLQELQRKKDSDLLAKALNLSSTYGTSPASDSKIKLLEINSHAGHGESYSFHPSYSAQAQHLQWKVMGVWCLNLTMYAIQCLLHICIPMQVLLGSLDNGNGMDHPCQTSVRKTYSRTRDPG